MITTTPNLTACWQYLTGVPFDGTFDDLEDIPPSWVDSARADAEDPVVLGSLEGLSWKDLQGFAEDLRDYWHTALAEAMQWDRFQRYDYD